MDQHAFNSDLVVDDDIHVDSVSVDNSTHETKNDDDVLLWSMVSNGTAPMEK